MWVSNDWYGLLIVAGSLLTFLGIAEVWRKQGGSPEVTRKFVHACGGMICLLLPFLIQSMWVVLGFALSIFAIFYVASKKDYFMSIHGVARATHGTVYYPLAIFIIFFLSGNQPWLYVTSILVLALCDSAASLVGSKYGQHFYNVESSKKSVEGSMTFMLLAYLVIQVPTLLMTTLDPEIVVLSSLLVAILVTGVEAISLRGTDNLFVPVSVCLFLTRISTKTYDEILYQNLSLLFIWVTMIFVIWRMPAFNVGASILLVLFTYGAWSLGSELWALPVFMMSIVYFILWYRYKDHKQFKFTKVRRTTKALTVPFIVLFLANYFDQYELFYPSFLAANTVLFMAIFVNFVRYDPVALKIPNVLRGLIITTLTWAFVCLPSWYLGGDVYTHQLLWIWGVVFILSAITVYLPVLTDEQLDRLNSKNLGLPAIAALGIFLVSYFL